MMGQQRREDAALAHAPGDQLRVLPAVVEYDDVVIRLRPQPGGRLGRDALRLGGIANR